MVALSFRTENRRVHQLIAFSDARLRRTRVEAAVNLGARLQVYLKAKRNVAEAFRCLSLSLKDAHIRLMDLGGISVSASDLSLDTSQVHSACLITRHLAH